MLQYCKYCPAAVNGQIKLQEHTRDHHRLEYEKDRLDVIINQIDRLERERMSVTGHIDSLSE